MNAARIDAQIAGYLPQLNEQQKKALLTVGKAFAEENTEGKSDAAFWLEIDSRTADYEAGKPMLSTATLVDNVRKRFSDKRGS